MPKTTIAIAVLTLLFIPGTKALQSDSEKIPLTHDVYDGWKNINRPQLSDNGRWASWEVNPQQGDGWLYLLDLKNNKLDSVARGNSARFSPNSDFMAFYVSPPSAVIRQARADGLKPDEMPGDSVGIYVFDNVSNTTAGQAVSFAVAKKESSWMVYNLKPPRGEEDEPGTGGNQGRSQAAGSEGTQERSPESGSDGTQERSPESGSDGADMFIFNPATGEHYIFYDVLDFSLSGNGRLVGFIQSDTEPEKQVRVRAFNTSTRLVQEIFAAPGTAKNITTCDGGRHAAFIHTADTSAPMTYTLYHWEEGSGRTVTAACAGTAGMPGEWSVSEHGNLRFSDDAGRLFFGTAPVPAPEPKDTLLSEERYSVDIWHYQDPRIQPQQLVQASGDARRTYDAVYHTGPGKMVQLATPDIPGLSVPGSGNSDIRYATATSDLPYMIQNSFESGEYRDVYITDLTTGERRLVLEKHRGSVHLSTHGNARLSEAGRYLLWFSQSDSNWYAMPAGGGERINLTGGIPCPLYDELHDTPSLPGPYGIAGWVEDDAYVLIYDRFDIWKVDPSGLEPPAALTGGYGRANNIQLRYVGLDSETVHIGAREEIMLSAFDLTGKQSGFYTVRVNRPSSPTRRTMDDVRYFTPVKAKNADVLLWRRSTFSEFPDLWVSNSRFRDARRITRANPQQDNYRWGDVGLVEWVSFANDTLQGLLYTPSGMEPGRKYPMIVYFYERLSHNLHAHYIPSPSRSTISISYYVSNGYVIFVPDIPYITGYPGQSAYNAVVSGTQAMADRHGFIDRSRIGIQGQSWGGYQIAWIITRTGLFRAAMAGAPVSNMISAYGGIRWATGLSRIYQYEETQSRIGGTIWDQTLRYLENSPVLFADRVTTPLLMMHNDADGAVPWYQGIEYYMALRRLGSPVWLLNYNNEAHNLTRRPNMVDLSIRMQQFFDHYLKNMPAPLWMVHGIPATEKGRTGGYEPVQ